MEACVRVSLYGYTYLFFRDKFGLAFRQEITPDGFKPGLWANSTFAFWQVLRALLGLLQATYSHQLFGVIMRGNNKLRSRDAPLFFSVQTGALDPLGPHLSRHHVAPQRRIPL